MQKNLFWRLGVYLVGFLVLTTSCLNFQGKKVVAEPSDFVFGQTEIQYAQNFLLQDYGPHVRLLTIIDPEHSDQSFRYALLDSQASVDSLPTGYTPLQLPISNCIVMTSLQLSNFIALDATECVRGVNSTRHLFNEKMQQQICIGHTQEIGIEGNFDNEVVIAIDPQLVFISPSKRGGYDVLQDCNVPLMPHLGYQEQTPLGQCEWVKLVGILTGRESEANTYFAGVELRYKELVSSVSQVSTPAPTIMSGDTKGGSWYATGGRSFLAQIFHDAGAAYVMSNDDHTGGVNMDFEVAYVQGADAEFWRVSNSFEGEYSYEELRREDSRFADFRAFREHKVIYCNMAQTPFYESFPVHPDLLLADFIACLHPSLLPDYTPTYYHLLAK